MFSTIFESILGSKIYHPIAGLTNDSRQGKRRSYIAINGKNNDGHEFLDEAKKKGAVVALVNEINKDFDCGNKVKDTIESIKRVK